MRRAVYELTAVVAHVVDAAEEGLVGAAPEGHLVAHIKVLYALPEPQLQAGRTQPYISSAKP